MRVGVLHLNFLGCTYFTFCFLRQNFFFVSFKNQGTCCQLGYDSENHCIDHIRHKRQWWLYAKRYHESCKWNQVSPHNPKYRDEIKKKKKKRVDLPYCISGKQFQLGNTWKSLIKYNIKELKFYIYSYSYCSILNLEDKECFSFFSKLFLTSWIFPSLHLSLSRHHSIKVNFKIF